MECYTNEIVLFDYILLVPWSYFSTARNVNIGRQWPKAVILIIWEVEIRKKEFEVNLGEKFTSPHSTNG
jgi:hypothetical protein